MDRNHRVLDMAPETFSRHNRTCFDTPSRMYYAAGTTSTRLAHNHSGLARLLHLEYLLADHEFERV